MALHTSTKLGSLSQGAEGTSKVQSHAMDAVWKETEILQRTWRLASSRHNLVTILVARTARGTRRAPRVGVPTPVVRAR